MTIDSHDLTDEELQRSRSLRPRLERIHWLADFLCNRSLLRTGGPVDHAASRLLTKVAGHRFGGRPSLIRAGWRALSRLFLPDFSGRLVCPTRLGFDLCLSADGGGNYYRFGFYEPATLAILERFLNPGSCFIDVGASVGQMSLFASKIVGARGKVVAVEPLPERHQHLRNSVTINGCSNVVLLPVGLGATSGRTDLYLDRRSPSMVPSDNGQTSGDQKISVPLTTLDTVAAELCLEQVDLVKIDVEGYEIEVLRGAERLLSGHRPPVLVFEYGVYPAEGAIDYIRSVNPEYQFYYSRHGNSDARPQLVRLEKELDAPPAVNIYAFPGGHVLPSQL